MSATPIFDELAAHAAVPDFAAGGSRHDSNQVLPLRPPRHAAGDSPATSTEGRHARRVLGFTVH